MHEQYDYNPEDIATYMNRWRHMMEWVKTAEGSMELYNLQSEK